MVKTSPLGSVPMLTIGAGPVRTIRSQLTPPSVDRSISPGVLQSPTVARQAVLDEIAKSSRATGTDSTGGVEGVGSVEAAVLVAIWSSGGESEDVVAGDDVLVGEPSSPGS